MPESPAETEQPTPVRLLPAQHRDLVAAFERDRWAGEWNSLPTAIERVLTEQRDMDYDMHLAYRPEVVAEIAVRLDEEHDWEATAKWCGGTLRNAEVADSGEYESYIDIPGVGAAWQGSWITLDHDGRFRIRTEVDGPERPSPPGITSPGSSS